MSIEGEKENSFEFSLEGKKIIFKIDNLSNKNNRSIVGYFGNTVVLTTLIVKKLKSEHSFPFFPLTVFFEERLYAVGKIPSNFNKREGKTSNEGIIISRLIDRSLRNLFPIDERKHEVQIFNHILSVDSEYDPRIISCLNSSLICFISSDLYYFSSPPIIIFKKKKDRNFNGELELTISIVEEKINMLECKANEIKENKLEEIIYSTLSEAKKISDFFYYVSKKIINSNILEEKKVLIEEKKVLIEEEICKELEKLIFSNKNNIIWNENNETITYKKEEIITKVSSTHNLDIKYIDRLTQTLFENKLKQLIKKKLSEEGKRIDNRGKEEIRPIKIEIDYLPNDIVHGSAFFSRGETKVLSTVTIGKISEKQVIGNVFGHYCKFFFHHYNFPNFSVNEISTRHSLSRREIGHGDLIEKTFLNNNLIPSIDFFPYTLRTVSEVFSSDGSSSQASICSTSLALMSAGIPLKRLVAGISLGLFENDILVDISGLEDKLGDMDFKIAGTEKGICSLQLDVKNRKGINLNLFSECLKKAHKARNEIIIKMKKHILKPREKLPDKAIKCKKIYIDKEKIGHVIGIKGKTIKKIILQTGIDFELYDNNHILIYHQEEKKINDACELINQIIS